MRLLLIAILSMPMFALAAPTIKVTSFVMNDNTNFRDTTAEICGEVTNFEKKHPKVIIISDPGRNQGYYVAHLAPNGKFCHVVRTITRNAKVMTYDHKEEPTAPRSSKIYSVTN